MGLGERKNVKAVIVVEVNVEVTVVDTKQRLKDLVRKIPDPNDNCSNTSSGTSEKALYDLPKRNN